MFDTSHHPISLLIVDRDKLVCHGFRTLIMSDSDFQVVGEANNGAEALILLEREKPEVVLLELDFGEESGLEIMQDLLNASDEVSVLILTHERDAEVHRKAMTLGASGVMQKDADLTMLLKAIRKVHAGEIWYDRSKLGSVLRDMVRNVNLKKEDPTTMKVATLTPREREVIALISKGLKNREIGGRLFISETTVRHHLTSIFDKLEISNRLELIIFALSSGLATLPENLTSERNDNARVALHSSLHLRRAV